MAPGAPVRENSSLTIGFPKESHAEEKRAAAVPETVAKLVKAGFGAVVVESGLGLGSGIEDAAYVNAGV
jgi:NAD/NADP transhydrogenase alpha subunit